jgi:hypothetical protein
VHKVLDEATVFQTVERSVCRHPAFNPFVRVRHVDGKARGNFRVPLHFFLKKTQKHKTEKNKTKKCCVG